MPGYIDPLIHHGMRLYGKPVESCHLFADTENELHRLAKTIGLRKRWFHDKKVPHYDLTKSKRTRAIEAGAEEMTRDEAVNYWRQKGWVSQ